MNCLHNVVKTLHATGIGICVKCGAQVFEQDGKWFLEKDWPKANDKDYPAEFERRLKETSNWLGEKMAVSESESQEKRHVATVISEVYSRLKKMERVKALVFMRLNASLDKRDKKAIELYREIQEAMR